MLTYQDQFCGAGGSSQGMSSVPGLQLQLAANHWKLAVESHSANFPDADHDVADISSIHPRRWPKADILWSSAECTNHTTAKNHDQARRELSLFDPDKEAERSRATMWDVPRFAEYHDYSAVICENVVEVRSWLFFDEWLTCMHKLGYEHAFVYWNSAFQPWGVDLTSRPAPQSRDRMYTVFWKKGNRRPDLDLRIAAWCPTCGGSVPGRQRFKSTFEDKLAAATARATKSKPAGVRPDRIRWGLYGQQYDVRCTRCHNEAFPWMPAALNALDFSIPAMRIGERDTPLADKTMARIRRGLEKYGNRQFVVVLRSGRPNRVQGTDDPLATLMAGAIGHGLCVPLDYPGHSKVRSTDDPLYTQSGRASTILVKVAGHTFEHPGSAARSQPLDDPMKTVTATPDTAMVGLPNAFIASLRGGGSQQKADHIADGPMGTFSADGNHHMLVAADQALIVSNYSPGRCWPADAEPLGGITGVDHHAVLGRFVDTTNGVANPKGVDEALTTIRGTDNHALVEMPRAFMVPAGGTWSEKAVPVTQVGATQLTREAYGLAEVTEEDIENCTYRMLEPKEVGAGMAFEEGYIVLGTKRDKVRQYGNAVTPNVAELLGRAVAESLL